MPEIELVADCGNSPKNTLIRDFNVAWVNRNIQALAEMVRVDVVWEIVGVKTVKGKDAFLKAVSAGKSNNITRLTLNAVISHGKNASANGTRVFRSGKVEGYADFYQFSSAKGNFISIIRTYAIDISESDHS